MWFTIRNVTLFTPQTKGIPEDTFAMHTSLQGDILMYTGVR